MYRLLIVEDEKWEREGLRDFLDWNGMGIDVAGCACNGEEGLKMAELYQPEIILTDIMMPRMDGIQMSLNIRAFLPDSRIIILSGYDDFQYAKQTFDFHAFAYLLKPIDKKSLEQTILSVRKDLEQEKCRSRERDALKSRWMDYVCSNRDRLFTDLLDHRMKLEDVPELAAVYGLRTTGRKVIAILYLFQDPEKNGACPVMPPECADRIMNAVVGWVEERGIVCSFTRPFKEAVLYMDAPTAQAELEKKLQLLTDYLKKEFEIEAIVGVGEAAEDFSGAPMSYAQAKEAGSFRFLAGYGELLFYSMVKGPDWKDTEKARQSVLKSNDIIKKILYKARRGDLEETALLVDEFLSSLRENPSTGKMLLNSFYTEVVSGMNAVSPENKSEVTSDSLSQTRQLLMEALKKLVVPETEKSVCNEDEVTKKVIELIERRYADELDLNVVSEEIHLSPYYIGSIFKKNTGKQFNKYLTEYRLDRAKELLQTGKIKVGQLAESVGISNHSYFCALFRSRFGISPGDYMDILKGGREYV